MSRKEERKDAKEGSSDRLVGPARSLTDYPLALANPPGNVPVCLFFKARSRQDKYHVANQRAEVGMKGGWMKEWRTEDLSIFYICPVVAAREVSKKQLPVHTGARLAGAGGDEGIGALSGIELNGADLVVRGVVRSRVHDVDPGHHACVFVLQKVAMNHCLA